MIQNIEVNVKVKNVPEASQSSDNKNISQGEDMTKTEECSYMKNDFLQSLKMMPKTASGIVVNLPIEYYKRILFMKIRTGVNMKDLALQTVIEFLDRNKEDSTIPDNWK